MYIFSYCLFLAPQIITSCYCITLVIRNSKPCGAPSLPFQPQMLSQVPRPLAVTQLQLKVFGVLSVILLPAFLTLITQTDASYFEKWV